MKFKSAGRWMLSELKLSKGGNSELIIEASHNAAKMAVPGSYNVIVPMEDNHCSF